MNQNFRRSDITYGVKKDQNIKSQKMTFDVLFDVLINHFIFDVLINLKKEFQRSDPFQLFDFQLSDFRCSDPFPPHSLIQSGANSLKTVFEEPISDIRTVVYKHCSPSWSQVFRENLWPLSSRSIHLFFIVESCIIKNRLLNL